MAAAAILILAFVHLVAGTSLALAGLAPADPSWVWSEVNLWVSAALLVVAVLIVPRQLPARPQPN